MNEYATITAKRKNIKQGYSEILFYVILAKKGVLWLCGKLLNFNYKLFGGEIQEMG